MATILNADTISGGFIATGDSSGILQLQSSGTPSLTLNTSGAHGVGSSPSYGTSGQVLQSNGSSAAPSWVTPSGGAMVLISTQTASSSSDLHWTGLSGYDKYLLVFENFRFSHNYEFLCCQLGTGSGPTYATSGYTFIAYDNSYNGVSVNLASSTYSAPSSPNSTIYIADSNITGTSANGISSGIILFSGFTSGSYQTYSTNSFGQDSGNNTLCNSAGAGMLNQTSNVTAIKIYPASPSGYTITSGTASLYGISS